MFRMNRLTRNLYVYAPPYDYLWHSDFFFTIICCNLMRNTIEYLLKKKKNYNIISSYSSIAHFLLATYTGNVNGRRVLSFILGTEIRWLPRCRVVYVVNLLPIVLFIPRLYMYIIQRKYVYLNVYSNNILKYDIIYCA